MSDAATRFRTRELSAGTFPDFERFFSQVHGCACTLYFFGRHLSPVAGSSEQRAVSLGSAPDRGRKHFPDRDVTVRRLRRTFGWRSGEVADYLRDTWPSKYVAGIGQLSACLVTSRTMGHMGSMSMFDKAGFRAIRRDEQRSTDGSQYPRDFVVMQLHV